MNADHLTTLQAALSHIDQWIARAVAAAQAQDYDPGHQLRGLVMTPAEIQHYASREPLSPLWQDTDKHPALFHPTEDSVLGRLMTHFNLTVLDLNLLLLCAAPHFDLRYERLYAYLQDNVSHKFATPLLLVTLLVDDIPARFEVLSRLYPQAPLRKHGLLQHSSSDRDKPSSYLMQALTVEPRIVRWLLGDAALDLGLQQAVRWAQGRDFVETTANIQNPITDSIFVQMATRDTALAESLAVKLSERPVLVADVIAIHRAEDSAALWQSTVRESYLHGACLLLMGWDHFAYPTNVLPDELWQALIDYPYPVWLMGESNWQPLTKAHHKRTLHINQAELGHAQRVEAWCHLLDQHPVQTSLADIEALAARFKVTISQVEQAVQLALDHAYSRDGTVSTRDLYKGAQAVSVPSLEQLAQPLRSHYEWHDLVLPDDQLKQLGELRDRLTYAHIIQNEWGFGRRQQYLAGVKVLFAGESGTGKTMAAQVLANDLGMLLYRIDLSMVVSKYIGETEKNLRNIFNAARHASAILFFDEADALFGKRSEVKDAHDRYANIETSYLLQQFEQFDGIAILATNLRQNMDKAFTRRLDFLVDFPFPDAPYRRTIWQKQFPQEAPLDDQINFEELSERYHLAGGNIRNAAIAAAYLAAANGQIIDMAHIQHAIKRERQKMGRLIT